MLKKYPHGLTWMYFCGYFVSSNCSNWKFSFIIPLFRVIFFIKIWVFDPRVPIYLVPPLIPPLKIISPTALERFFYESWFGNLANYDRQYTLWTGEFFLEINIRVMCVAFCGQFHHLSGMRYIKGFPPSWESDYELHCHWCHSKNKTMHISIEGPLYHSTDRPRKRLQTGHNGSKLACGRLAVRVRAPLINPCRNNGAPP